MSSEADRKTNRQTGEQVRQIDGQIADIQTDGQEADRHTGTERQVDSDQQTTGQTNGQKDK